MMLPNRKSGRIKNGQMTYTAESKSLNVISSIYHNINIPDCGKVICSADVSRDPLPFNVTAAELESGKYGEVTQENPLEVYLIGRWSFDSDIPVDKVEALINMASNPWSERLAEFRRQQLQPQIYPPTPVSVVSPPRNDGSAAPACGNVVVQPTLGQLPSYNQIHEVSAHLDLEEVPGSVILDQALESLDVPPPPYIAPQVDRPIQYSQLVTPLPTRREPPEQTPPTVRQPKQLQVPDLDTVLRNLTSELPPQPLLLHQMPN